MVVALDLIPSEPFQQPEPEKLPWPRENDGDELLNLQFHDILVS